MPYKTKPLAGGRVAVVKKETGDVVAVHEPPDADEKAIAQMRLLYALEDKKQKQ